jgi:hypothetical protein
VLIVGEEKSGVMVAIDASLKIEEVVKIAGSSKVLVIEQSKEGGVKELIKTQNVSGVSPPSAN